ncbi:MAG: hypothetical protein IJ357_02745 [Oscillospiraceae bacterium]|nr:hypothetical protein [Oscillospiraceae bacterium]
MKLNLKSLLPLLVGVLVIVLVTVLLSQCMLSKVRSFELADWEELLGWYAASELPEEYPFLTEPVGPVGSAKEAKAAAEEIWVRLYGETVTEQKPYDVYYDESEGVWLVCGSYSTFSDPEAGTAVLLLEAETGEILAVRDHQ